MCGKRGSGDLAMWTYLMLAVDLLVINTLCHEFSGCKTWKNRIRKFHRSDELKQLGILLAVFIIVFGLSQMCFQAAMEISNFMGTHYNEIQNSQGTPNAYHDMRYGIIRLKFNSTSSEF
jgi:hypothetical protein